MSGDRRITGDTISLLANHPIIGPLTTTEMPYVATLWGGEQTPGRIAFTQSANQVIPAGTAAYASFEAPGTPFPDVASYYNFSNLTPAPKVTFTATPGMLTNEGIIMLAPHGRFYVNVNCYATAIGASPIGIDSASATLGYVLPEFRVKLSFDISNVYQPPATTANRAYSRAVPLGTLLTTGPADPNSMTENGVDAIFYMPGRGGLVAGQPQIPWLAWMGVQIINTSNRNIETRTTIEISPIS
jgi:hypothetical protein